MSHTLSVALHGLHVLGGLSACACRAIVSAGLSLMISFTLQTDFQDIGDIGLYRGYIGIFFGLYRGYIGDMCG